MTTPSSFLVDVSALLDSIEAALVAQNPETVQSLCAQLQQTLQARTRTAVKDSWTSPESQALALSIDKRLALLRKTLLQQGAAAERALATLLPDRAVGGYGEKSGFGQAARGPNLKSYQA
jgi:hypothetical protein